MTPGSGRLYGDKAYCDAPTKERLVREQDLGVFTPVKKKKRQKYICEPLTSSSPRASAGSGSRFSPCSTGSMRRQASSGPRRCAPAGACS